jgi:tetratricopeptide (TPR) repeat protein
MLLHRSIFKRACCMLLPVVGALALQAQETGTYEGPDFSKFQPVRLEIIQQSGPLGARFVHPTAEGIEIEMLEGDGEIVVGWDHMDQFRINKPMTDELNRALSHSDPAERVRLLRAEVEPLLPLASIKPGSTNVHYLINAYVESSIAAEDWLAAYEMSQKMLLDRSPEDVVKNFYQVAINLFVTGEQDKAFHLLDQLIAARPVEESRQQTVEIGGYLLAERLFGPAYRLLRVSALDAKGLKGKQVVLECAYLCLELNDPEGAARYLAQAQAIPEDNAETRGARQLVLGVQAFNAGEPSLALNHLAHAMAELAPDGHLKQVGLYYNFLSYTNLGHAEIAQNILDEMQLLFPRGAYTKVLGESDATATPETTTTL